ncbi:SgcJ/EcaC family oxidoreductase [Flavitalea flava]
MKFLFTFFFSLAFLAGVSAQTKTMDSLSTSSNSGGSVKEEETITKILDAFFVAGWNTHDAPTFSMAFTDDADFTNVVGMGAHGRAEIEKFHARIFATWFKDSNLKITGKTVRFIKPDVAAVDVLWEMTGAKLPGRPENEFRKGLANLIMTKTGDKWRVIVMHNMDIPVNPPGK